VWKTHAEALRDLYAKHDVAFLDPPAASCGAEGFLESEYRGDAFHANAAYGRLLLSQIDDVLKTQNY
jgi:hypothetical protein